MDGNTEKKAALWRASERQPWMAKTAKTNQNQVGANSTRKGSRWISNEDVVVIRSVESLT